MATVLELQDLEQNWDGYDGTPPNISTIANANMFERALMQDGHETDATPNPNGTITIEWWNGTTRCVIEVGATRAVALFEDNKTK